MKITPAFKFILLIGVLSLFSDMVYEGARGVTGPFFVLLGASGAIVGFVAGFGELAGNALRIVSGYIADRTKQYWLLVCIGYTGLLAIPALYFVKTWQMAAVLIIIERIGKAIRTPARDAMLSYATQQIGRGKGFGIHQVFDQIGAALGPLLMTLILIYHDHYQTGFALLLIPTLLAFSVLFIGKKYYPRPEKLESKNNTLSLENISEKYGSAFWIFLIASCCLAAGYADFPLIAFHLEKMNIAPVALIPVFLIIAMLVSTLSALFFGWLYDRAGLKSIILAIIFSAFFAPCVFGNGIKLAIFGMILWGIGMGAQKSLLKAVVSDMTHKSKRASAFGIFNTGYGIAWFLGSWFMGYLYDHAVTNLMIFSVGIQVLAIFVIITMKTGVFGMNKNTGVKLKTK